MRFGLYQSNKVNFVAYFVASSLLAYFFAEVLFLDRVKETGVPVLVWTTPLVPNRKRLVECYNGKHVCQVSRDRSQSNISAYLFYGSHLDKNEFPLPRNNVTWALYHEESPRNYPPFMYEDVQDLFDVTATFSRLSDFPLTLQYLPNLTVLTDTQYFVPTHQKNELLKTQAPVLYIQSDCDTPIERDEFVKQLMIHIDVDSYGACLYNKGFPPEIKELYALDLYNPKYLQFIASYKFIIAIENAECYDYVTEKLWRPLIVGSIPIYLGSPTVADWLPNVNSSAILVNSFDSALSVVEYINKINEDDSLYESFLAHKLQGQITNPLLTEAMSLENFGKKTEEHHTIPAFECFVCKKIHEGTKRQTNQKNIHHCLGSNEKFWSMYWNIAKCQAKALKHLILQDQPFTNKSYEDLWSKYNEANLC